MPHKYITECFSSEPSGPVIKPIVGFFFFLKERQSGIFAPTTTRRPIQRPRRQKTRTVARLVASRHFHNGRGCAAQSGCDRPPPTKPTVSPSAPWNYLILHQMSIWILLIDNHVLFFSFSIAITSHAPCFTFTFLWGYSRIPANCEFVTICTSLHKNIQPVSAALEWLGWRRNTIATVTTYYTVK